MEVPEEATVGAVVLVEILEALEESQGAVETHSVLCCAPSVAAMASAIACM